MSWRYFLLSPSSLCGLAFIILPTVLDAGAAEAMPDVHAQQDGVTLDAYTRDDRIVFCFSAEKNVKVASDYGVEFKVPVNELNLWDEHLPKLVTKTGWYFDLPLRIDLKTRDTQHERQIDVNLGACTSAKYCTPITLRIIIPAHQRETDKKIVCGK